MPKSNNYFRVGYNQHGQVDFHVQIGCKIYPEYHMQSHAEAHYKPTQTKGVQSSSVQNFARTRPTRKKNNMSLGINTEEPLGARFRRLNTRAGDVMTIKLKYTPTTITSGEATRIHDRTHIALRSDQILEMRNTSVRTCLISRQWECDVCRVHVLGVVLALVL